MFEKEDLNLLYECALEWGEHWLRPLIEWAKELFPEWDEEKQIEICAYIDSVRDEINDYISDRYDQEKHPKENVKNWIKQKFPWMTDDLVARGYSQGMYYAWHG